MERWLGKIAVVTGASSGIGAAIAEKLVKQGLKVVGFARRKEKIDEHSLKLKGERGILFSVKVDLTKPEEIINGFKWVKENLGCVHVLINNAGIAKKGNLIDGNYDSWNEIFQVNVLGLCVATREAVTQMKENKIDGHIIHINSISGHYVPNFPGINVYPASKHSVTALAETLRHEFNNQKLNIKITNLSPGSVRSDFGVKSGLIPKDVPEEVIAAFPLLKPEDVANAVIYVLGTPINVLISELTIRPMGENF